MSVVYITISILYLFLFKTDVNNVFAKMSLDDHPNLKLLPDNCGERIVRFRNVSSKNDVFVNQFPFIAALQVRKEKPYPVCVGSLINERYILTSAFCARIRETDLVNVRLGEYNFKTEVDCGAEKNKEGESSCNDPIQDIKIESRIFHERYESKYKNDIALVRLAQPVNLTRNNVRTICLPGTAELRSENYRSGQLVNFNNDQKNSLTFLRRTFVQVNKEREECEKYYLSNDIYRDVKKKYICGHIDNSFATKGVSGSPLMHVKKTQAGQKDKYVQFGFFVASDGTNIPDNVNKKGGVLFLNITEYMQWVLDNLKP